MSRLIKVIPLMLLVLVSNLFGQFDDKFKELDENVRIAILQLDNNGVTESEAKALTDRLRLEIFRHEKYEVMERQKMNEILDEMEFQLSGCTSNECAVEIGRLIGVQKMVAGSVSKVGDIFTVSARIIDIESGRMEKTAVKDIEGNLGLVLTKGILSISAQLCDVDEPEYYESQMLKEEEPEVQSEIVEIIKTTIKVYSAPGGSEVYLDDIYKGTTPVTIEVEPNTSYQLRISKQNYSNHQQSVYLEEGETKDLSIVLSKLRTEPVVQRQVEQYNQSYKPEEKSSLTNKVFRLSFSVFGEVESFNDYVQRFNDSEMNSFLGFCLTSGRSISNFIFIDFSLGAMFSNFIDEEGYEPQMVMPFATVDLRLHPLGKSLLSPYGMVGYGYNFMNMNSKDEDGDIAYNANFQAKGLTFGGGLEIRMADSFGLDIEWNKRDMEFEILPSGLDYIWFKLDGLGSFKVEDNLYKINLNFYR